MQITMGQTKFCSNFGFGCILPTKGDTVISSPAKTLHPWRLPASAGLPFPLGSCFLASSIAAAAPFIPSPASKGTTCLVAFCIHFLPRRAISMGTLGRAIYAVGFWIRETGQAIDRLGSRLQGNYLFQEQISRHRTLMNIFDKVPNVHKDAFVAPSASVIGDVQVGHGSSIWYGCVLRGDVNSIYVGSGTNIQDNSLVHVAKSNLSGKVLPTRIGDNVTVGHSAVLHGCTVENESFVGMGAVLLDGVVVEEHGMVAAGSLVRQNTKIPSGEVWGGNPAKFLRKLTDKEIAFIAQSATNYANLAQVHAAENSKTFDEIEFEKVLRKKFARRDEEYDSMLGVVRETPPELILPDNILPDKARAADRSSSQ